MARLSIFNSLYLTIFNHKDTEAQRGYNGIQVFCRSSKKQPNKYNDPQITGKVFSFLIAASNAGINVG
jgi:hypothetical protein